MNVKSVEEIELEPGWKKHLETEFKAPYLYKLKQFLIDEKRAHKLIYPPGKLYFNAFNLTPFDKVKVVILGQDPYHGHGQAHGLCFSVPDGVQPPPSLLNIFKELVGDLGCTFPKHGNLTHWAKEGVFLLNTILTVEAGNALSHQGKGWEFFTDKAIQVLNEQKENLVFLLWGSPAGQKNRLINPQKHLVLMAPHPSPLSASRGFFGCRHFSRTNHYLALHGRPPINWQLP